MQTPTADHAQLVVVRAEDGYRVFSPLTPATQFIVRDTGEDITCTCPEFESRKADPEFQCTHILAVLEKSSQGTAPKEGSQPREKKSKSSGGQMVLKRSVSPDGKIDALSFEFSCDIAGSTAEELKRKAEQILTIQTAITSQFLKSNKPINGNGGQGNGLATVVDVGGMNTRRGRRLFLNISANGQVLKLFGTSRELAEALASAGIGNPAQQVTEGMQFNLPCRVMTKPSADGKYVNIDRILPAQP